MSSMAIEFYYNGYPVGKVKLNGRKRTLMYFASLTKVQNEHISEENYVELINRWIYYVRRHLRR